MLFYFLTIDLYFLISAVIEQIFNPIAELVIPIGMPSIEVQKQNLKKNSNCGS